MLTGFYVVVAEGVDNETPVRLQERLDSWAPGRFCVLPIHHEASLCFDRLEGEELQTSPANPVLTHSIYVTTK